MSGPAADSEKPSDASHRWRRTRARASVALVWTFRISSGVSQGIDKSVVQSDREFLRIGVDGRR